MSNNKPPEPGSPDANPHGDGPELVLREAHLAFGILSFVAALALFVVLYGVLDIFVADLFNGAGLEAEGQQLTDTQEYVSQTWTLLPFLAVVILSVRFIARAAFESRGGV
jgi:heme/copper-type cytochrome/quinol oxidase subunit 2